MSIWVDMKAGVTTGLYWDVTPTGSVRTSMRTGARAVKLAGRSRTQTRASAIVPSTISARQSPSRTQDCE